MQADASERGENISLCLCNEGDQCTWKLTIVQRFALTYVTERRGDVWNHLFVSNAGKHSKCVASTINISFVQ